MHYYQIFAPPDEDVAEVNEKFFLRATSEMDCEMLKVTRAIARITRHMGDWKANPKIIGAVLVAL